MRSWLVIPADNPEKMSKAAQTGADAMMINLAGVMSAEERESARENAANWLRDNHNPKDDANTGADASTGSDNSAGGAMHWVRISGLDTQHWREDLFSVIAAAPDGIVLADAAGPSQVQILAAEIWELEQANGIQYSSTSIIPEVGSLPASAMTMHQFLTDPHPRLLGFTWNAQLLAARIGATRLRGDAGGWIDPLAFVRAQLLLLSKSLKLMAVDSAHPGFRNLQELQRVTTAARADGFTGMTALHPLQLSAIDTAFTPTEAEFAEAKEIVALFDANPNSANVAYNGRTLEKSHLELARTLLALE